jgi:hypothetical protein
MSTAQELRTLFRLRILELAGLASLFAFVVWRSLSLKLTVRDLDNWWHLKGRGLDPPEPRLSP